MRGNLWPLSDNDATFSAAALSAAAFSAAAVVVDVTLDDEGSRFHATDEEEGDDAGERGEVMRCRRCAVL